MVHTILVVLLIGTVNSVSCENIDLGKDTTLSVNLTDILPDTKVHLTPENIDVPVPPSNETEKIIPTNEAEKIILLNETEKIINTSLEKLNITTKQEIHDIIGSLDKKLQDKKVVGNLANSTLPVVNVSKVVLPVIGSRSGFPQLEDQFYYYTQPAGFEIPVEPTQLNAYNFQRISESRRGSFAVFDSLTPEHTVSLPVRQILEGPINIAVPLINHEISLYFVNRGLKSVKFTPSLLPINEALNRPVRKIGLTIPAAFSLRSRYLSWPVKSVVFAEPVFLADISNTATYPTILFVPEDEFEVTRRTPDVFRIADFALLEDGIRYALPTPKQVI